MTSTADKIKKRLDGCRPFLAYIRGNALLHDADKVSAAFLSWSLAGGKNATADYPGHDSRENERLEFLENKMGSILPYQNDLQVNFPCPSAATEPTLLRRQAVTDLLAGKLNDTNFINKLRKSCNEDYAKIIAVFDAPNKDEDKEKAMRSFFNGDYTSILKNSNFSDIAKEFNQKKYPWCRSATPGISLFDFYRWHHEPAVRQKTGGQIPTAINLFTAGTAGLDGLDTAYETEPRKGQAKEHHRPIPSKTEFLISTPFGSERRVKLDDAETLAGTLNLTSKVTALNTLLPTSAALTGTDDPFTAIEELETTLQQVFEETIIRTGRPINDITLADHSLSTAALAGAHAARVVLETADAPSDTPYALPLRGKLRTNSSSWPTTAFAIFTCAVNAGRLDEMAMDLKDIAAIRREVECLFDHFITTLTRELPVGGFVYRDQHGAHLVVPVLGNPEFRWLKADCSTRHLSADKSPEVNWSSCGGEEQLSNEDFTNWLFATAEEKLKNLSLNFGSELLIILRHAVIGDELNRLADAISWTRAASFLGTGRPTDQKQDTQVQSFHYPNPVEQPAIRSDLCTVCGLRQQSSNERKCAICQQRVKEYPKKRTGIWKEMPDIRKMAATGADRRLALLSVALDLSPWLSETSNSGIFCYDKGTKNFRKKITDNQRSNSFGRLRRIWRSSQLLLSGLHTLIPSWAETDENGPLPVRTILLQPQDLQVILPAERALPIIDHITDVFHQAFGRVAGRVAIHVSLIVFPFRTPIYLVLDGSRRLVRACLDSHLQACTLQPVSAPPGNPRRTEAWNSRQFTYEMALTTQQEYQPKSSLMGGNDQFHANICTCIDTKGTKTWRFADDLPNGEQTVYMVRNRLSLAEVGSGLVLDELSRPAEELESTRCHSIPLEYWPTLKNLLEIQQRHLSSRQRRSLRSILANRERLWNQNDPTVQMVRELAAELLWRDPGRLGAKKWEDLEETTRQLLIDSCSNGALFFGGLVEKRLMNNTFQD